MGRRRNFWFSDEYVKTAFAAMSRG
ncbi:hypothetical protein A2U01_0059981, partial [Trifolium medium]|nr:hypothetical protein [Trifolium medium]